MEINKHVMMLASLEEELKRLALAIPGVKGAETKVGPGYYQTDVYRKFDFDLPLPSKVLLVDDERDFVEALSERLQMRDYSSAVVYDGEEALSIVEEDEPEVMVLDLKMPGIDGLGSLAPGERKASECRGDRTYGSWFRGCSQALCGARGMRLPGKAC